MFRFSLFIPYLKEYIHQEEVVIRSLSKIQKMIDPLESTNDLHKSYFQVLTSFEKYFANFYSENETERRKITLNFFGPDTPRVENQVVEFIQVDSMEELKKHFNYISAKKNAIVPTPSYLGEKTLKFIQKKWSTPSDHYRNIFL